MIPVFEGYAIRLLTVDDWRVFSLIRLEALQKFPSMFGSSYEKEKFYTEEEWKSWFLEKGRCFFGLYHGQSLIGITGAITAKNDPSESSGLMVASYIKPDYQGRGLSALLYKARIEWALDYLPWKKLIVAHREGNESSRRANQKCGVRLIGKESKTWPDGEIADEYVYELNLEDLRYKKT